MANEREALLGAGIGMLMAIHTAVRRDLERMDGALRVLAEMPGERVEAVGGVVAYWDLFVAQVHHHHEVEDTEVWPQLRRAADGAAVGVLEAMVAEHLDVVAAQSVASKAIHELSADADAATVSAARDRVAAFRDVLLAHLAHEERDAVPLMSAETDLEYWRAFMGRRQAEPAEEFLPWVLDGAPQQAFDMVTGEMPPPVRGLLIEQWVPARERVVAALPQPR